MTVNAALVDALGFAFDPDVIVGANRDEDGGNS
jgi:hypothetical protein